MYWKYVVFALKWIFDKIFKLIIFYIFVISDCLDIVLKLELGIFMFRGLKVLFLLTISYSKYILITFFPGELQKQEMMSTPQNKPYSSWWLKETHNCFIQYLTRLKNFSGIFLLESFMIVKTFTWIKSILLILNRY